MERTKIVQIDVRTGVEAKGLVVYVPPRRINGFRKGWVAMEQEALQMWAQRRKELGEEGLAILMMLLAQLDFENLLVLNQAEIGRKLGMHRQHVQRSIKRLMEMEVLLEGPKIGQSRSYRLNPNFGWKGTAKNHLKALDKHREERMKASGITGVVKGGAPEEEK